MNNAHTDEVNEDEDHVTELPLSNSRRNLQSSSTIGTQMTAAEKRDHSRKHSHIHSRNLSVFFPQPGSEAELEADAIRAYDTFNQRPRIELNTQYLAEDKEDHTITHSEQPKLRSEASPVSATSAESGLSPSKSRKGHHRKHSVAHSYNGNGLSRHAFMNDNDEQLQDMSGQKPSTFSSLATSASYDRGPVTNAQMQSSGQALSIFGICEFLLGANLWWRGQSGDSLSTTGLGYLLVFDALGIVSSVVPRFLLRKNIAQGFGEVDDTYRRLRVETLLHFIQTIFLLFAAIYICKESVEHALLKGSMEDHEEDDVGLQLPLTLLLVSAACTTFSNFILQNNVQLVAACNLTSSESSVSRQRNSLRGRHGRNISILADPSVIAGPFLHLLTNPFSVTILFFNYTLALAAFALHPVQTAALDKVLAGLQSAAMLYIAFPASKALGNILLQTAPMQHDIQSVQLLRCLQTIQEHPLITYIAPPKLWQLTPPTASRSTPNLIPGSSFVAVKEVGSRTAKNATLIASVEIFVAERATDADILDITRWAWQLLSPSVGAASGYAAGENMRGSLRAGEVTVQVSREGDKDRYSSRSHTHVSRTKDDQHTQMHNHEHHDSHTHTQGDK